MTWLSASRPTSWVYAVKCFASDITPDDWIYTPSVTVDILKPLGKESLFLRGSAGYSFYQKNPVLNAENLDLAGGANARLGPCRATITGDELRRRSELQYVIVTSPATVRNIEDNHSIGGDATCLRPTGLGVSFSASQDWDQNSSAPFRSNDYQRSSFSGGLVFQRPTFGELSLSGQYGQTHYTNRLILVAGQLRQDGYNSVSGNLSFDRRLGARIQATLSVGYSTIQPYVPGEPGFSGLTYSADIAYRPTGRITAHLMASQQTTPTNIIGASFADTRMYLAEGTYRIASRLNFTLGASQSQSRYHGAALIPGVDLAEQTTRQVYSALRFDLSRRFTISANAQYEEGEANLLAYDYHATRVGVSLAAAF